MQRGKNARLHGCVNRPNLVTGSTVCHTFRVVVAAGRAAAVSQITVLMDVKSVKRRRTTWKPGQVHRDRYIALRRLHTHTDIATVHRPRQLWGTGARAPPQLPAISFVVHFGVGLKMTANYCVVCEISWCKCQQLTFDQYCVSHKTITVVIEQLLHPALEFTVSAL